LRNFLPSCGSNHLRDRLGSGQRDQNFVGELKSHKQSSAQAAKREEHKIQYLPEEGGQEEESRVLLKVRQNAAVQALNAIVDLRKRKHQHKMN
jgi:hypothetical protein